MNKVEDKMKFSELKKVPLYKELYHDLQESYLSEHNLKNLPRLTKDLISKGFPNNWMTKELKKAIEHEEYEFMTTSGTTGERLQLIRPKNWWHGEEIRIFKYLNKIFPKYSHIESKAILTTAACSNTLCYKEAPSFEKRLVNGILHLNISPDPNKWTKEDIERMVHELDLHKPECLQADPIYLALFFKLLTKYKVKISKWTPFLLVLAYEYPQKKCLNFIKKFWNIPTLITYGTTEVGPIFHQCFEGLYHFIPDECFIEFHPIKDKKNIFEILITSFRNPFMPFVNFVTNDLVEIKDPKCTCGSSNIIINQFMGRTKDLTYSKNNHLITVGEIDNAISELSNTLLIYSLDFNFKDKIVFRYTTIDDKKLTSSHEDEILKALNALYENISPIEFSHEKEILPASSGKFEIIKNFNIQAKT